MTENYSMSIASPMLMLYKILHICKKQSINALLLTQRLRLFTDRRQDKIRVSIAFPFLRQDGEASAGTDLRFRFPVC